MLMPRGFQAIRRSSKAIQLTRDDVDFVTNPSDKYMDQFMEVHGNDRAVFKRSDIAQWQNSFKDYKFKLACLKGTKEIVATSQICKLDPIEGTENQPFYFLGCGWVHSAYRSPSLAKLLHLLCMEEVIDRENVVTQITIRRSSKAIQLTRDDVDFVTNPSEKYMDQFMEVHGNDRAVFKRSDIAQWQNSFKDYKFKLICLKDTTKILATSHVCKFEPIQEVINKQICFMGFGWVRSEYRSPSLMKLMHSICMEGVEERENIVSQINEPGRKFWHLMCGLKEYKDIGHLTGDVGYKSLYDAKDVIIPENLELKGITIRNARDVPKQDIIEYDQSIHPYHREKYIISHMYDRDGFGKVAYDEQGNVIGIGQAIIYSNKMDCNIGPMYADEPRVAQAMLREMLREIKDSDKKISQFEVRSAQMAPNSFHWIAPFLKCEPTRSHVCNLVYKQFVPNNIAFTKVYCPTHAQLFIV